MNISWHYTVLYKSSSAGPQKSFKDGTLTYYPASQKAELFNEEGESIDMLQPASATQLVEGGELRLENYLVQIEGIGKDQSNPKPKITSTSSESKPSRAESITESFHECMCTKDKNKKSKIWIDGWMHVLGEGRLVKFYLQEDNESPSQLIHTKKIKYLDEVKSGTILSTCTYLIEIMEKISNVEKIIKLKYSTHSKKESIPEVSQANNTNIVTSAAAAKYALLYTTDKIRKQRRWKDGFLQYTPKTTSTFYDEDGKILMRRSVADNDLTEGSEIITGMYIFQLGELLSQGEENIEHVENKNISKSNEIDRPIQISKKRPIVEVKPAGRSNSEIFKCLKSATSEK